MTWIILYLAKPWEREMERLERFLMRPAARWWLWAG